MADYNVSFEVFTPRSAKGLEQMCAPRGLLAGYASLGPRFISVSGPAGAGGSSTLKLVEAVKKGHCIRAQLHLPRAELTESAVVAHVDGALRLGAVDALVLGGAPGSLQTEGGGGGGGGNFGSALELVRFLKKRYGARLRVAVCGYPSGTSGEAGDYAADLAQTAKQVSAGADSVICLPSFEAATHTSYASDLRGAGVDAAVSIVPGILPLGPPADFRRICRALHVTVPDAVDKRLNDECTSEAATSAASRTGLVALMRELRAAGACLPHIYTLNSSALVADLAEAGVRPLKHRLPRP